MKHLHSKGLPLFLAVCAALFMIVSPVTAMEDSKAADEETLYSWIQSMPESRQLEIEKIMGTSPELFRDGTKNHLRNLADYTDWVCQKLRQIMDEREYGKFIELATKPVNRNKDRLAKVMTGCAPSCYQVYMWRLDYAQRRLVDARDDYLPVPYNCSVGSPDPIALAMNWGIFYLNKALDKTWDAYQDCDCSAANSGYGYTEDALEKIISARLATTMYCDPDPPWLSNLMSAENYADLAYDTYPNCISEACD